MKRKIICLLALTPLVLAGCDKPSNGSEESSASSNRTGDFVSSVNPVEPKPDESESPIDPKPGNYDELTEAYFNELKAGGVTIKGTITWDFSAEVTDSTTGGTYSADEKIVVDRFAGQASSTLKSEIRAKSTPDTDPADDGYNFRVFKNAKGNLTRLYVGADNKVHEVPYMSTDHDEDGYEIQVPTAYDTYFSNPFTQIKWNEIRKNSDGTYTVNSDDFLVSALFFGQSFEAERSTITLSVKDNVIHADLKTQRMQYEYDTSVYNWLTGSLDIQLASKTDIDKPQAYEEVAENLPLKNAFEELANALKDGGKGFDYNYLEELNGETYNKDITYMTPEGFVTEFSNTGKVPSGIAKYDDGKNYFFEFRNNKVRKSGTCDTLHLPDYSENALSAYVFEKEDENVYVTKTRALAQLASETIFDYYHKDNIYGRWASDYVGYEGTTSLRITLANGHVSTIDYNYEVGGKLINGSCKVTNINNTFLGYEFKTKQLGPVKAGYEHFMGDFFSYDYGSLGRAEDIPQYALRVYGDGKYWCYKHEEGKDDPKEPKTFPQGKLEGDTFTFTLPDGMSVSIKYYKGVNYFDLGYTDKQGKPTTTSREDTRYGETSGREHIFTFNLNPYSEWNKDSGLLKTDTGADAE